YSPLAAGDFNHVLIPEVKVTGRVCDEEGRPLNGVRIRPEGTFWAREAVHSDNNGRFTAGGLQRGRRGYVSIEPNDPRLLGQRILVEPHSDEAELTLDV